MWCMLKTDVKSIPDGMDAARKNKPMRMHTVDVVTGVFGLRNEYIYTADWSTTSVTSQSSATSVSSTASTTGYCIRWHISSIHFARYIRCVGFIDYDSNIANLSSHQFSSFQCTSNTYVSLPAKFISVSFVSPATTIMAFESIPINKTWKR